MLVILNIWNVGDEFFTLKQLSKLSGYTKLTVIKKVNQMYDEGLILSDNSRPRKIFLTEKGKSISFKSNSHLAH